MRRRPTIPEHGGPTRDAGPAGAVGDSVVVASWTMVSRITGFGRVAVTAAVLGPTFLGNTFQTSNNLPNIIYYGLLAGSLVSSLLVPALVGHIDGGDRRSCERVAGGALGMALLGVAIVIPVAALGVPYLLELGTLGSAAAAVGPEQERLARWFLLMLLPQMFLYAVVACSSAVMNAHRRFALAAAAPAIENVGAVAVLAATAVLYPGTGSVDIPTGQLLLLGLGSTAAVALHAAVQWYGARRVGVTLRPTRGWRDGEVRELAGRALPALAHASLEAAQLIAILVVANRVAGGVVAFQLAVSFFFLPIALGATPVALSLLPRLSRLSGLSGLSGHPDRDAFRDTAVRGLRFALFAAVPSAVALAVLAPVLASAVSFGAMAADRGDVLVAAALLALAPGVVGETAFLVATYASYSRRDTRSPLRSMVLKTAVCGGVLVPALMVGGSAVVAVAGLAMSVAAIIAAAHRVRALLGGLPGGRVRLRPGVWRTALAAAVMAGLLWPAAHLLTGLQAQPVALAGAIAACLAGGVAYLGVQWLLGAAELTWLAAALTGRAAGPVDEEGDPA